MKLNELAAVVHKANAKWWQDPVTQQPIKRNKGELIALMHSEISECDEGEQSEAMDDKLPHRKMGEVECVDAMIRIFDYSAGFSYDLDGPGSDVGINEFTSLNQLTVLTKNMSAVARELEKRGISLIHCKLSELLEHERKGRFDEAGEAIVNCLTHIAIYGALKAYDLQRAFDEKMKFNATREDHKHESRKIAGGKQF